VHRASRRHSEKFLSLPLRQLNPAGSTPTRITVRNKRDNDGDFKAPNSRWRNREGLNSRHFPRIYLYQHSQMSERDPHC